MTLVADRFSRVAKLFVDRDGLPVEEAEKFLSQHQVALVGGRELAASRTMQAALLTAANVATRCFPGAVKLYLPNDIPLLVPYPASSLVQAVIDVGVGVSFEAVPSGLEYLLAFGTSRDLPAALQVTFDNWVAAVAPAEHRLRLQERDGCVLAGVLGGALGVSELFMQLAGINVMAGHRVVGLSLWRPDKPWDDEEARGPEVEFLPSEYWFLGLGHLGQAYLWALGLLPWSDRRAVSLLLNDYDVLANANLGTGLVSAARDVGNLKTHVALQWLAKRGMHCRLLDRPFDEGVRRNREEPRLALCGFDGGGPRWALELVGFERVVECGLGGRADDFDTIAMHTFPHPELKAQTEWPRDAETRELDYAERLAGTNPTYKEFGEKHGCGQLELAGKSVAVPFVGAVSASLALSECVRMLHEGVRVGSFRMQLAALEARSVRLIEGGYAGIGQPTMDWQRANKTGRGRAQ